MRGIEARHELDPTMLLRDTRSIGQRLTAFFSDRFSVAIFIAACCVTACVDPELTNIMFMIVCGSSWYALKKKQVLPFRLPQSAKIKDFNDLKSGIGTPNMARGISYFGNDRKSKEELWFANDDMRTHVLIFGSTGAGKTETLVSLAFNALVQGSGFIYVDGKGDNSLYAKIFSMVRGMGREDDLLLVNFMTGARDIIGPQEKRLSNTLNPFCQGSSSMLTQLVVNLMGGAKGGGDGDMWKGRAISFVEALMRLLVFMRDDGAILLDADVIRNYFELTRLEAIVVDKVFPRDEQESVDISTIPKLVTDPLRNYVLNLPGYNKEKKGKQVSQVLEQHGFITMQLGRTFSSLADTYGHIIRTNLAEVDFKDVVLNRRILVVLLPALEKSPDELSNLGKIIVSSLKAMMAAGLGDEVEGDYRDVILRKPTNAPTPYMCILDEYGYYAVEGFAVVPAQARSLGFSVIFAGQDLPAFQKASKEEAASIGANTNVKICMKLEDPTETWDFFTKTAGEAYVTKVDSFQAKEGSMTNTYTDSRSSSYEKRARVDLLDLKDQTEGEAHIFFKSKIVRARMFYANPKPVKQLKVNQFLKVEAPPDDYITKLNKQFGHIEALIDSGDIFINEAVETEEISLINRFINENKHDNLVENSLAALIAYQKYFEPDAPEEVADLVHLEGFVNLFTPLKIDASMSILASNTAAFALPLVTVSELRSLFLFIEKFLGYKEQYSSAMANELIEDCRLSTNYPNVSTARPSTMSIAINIEQLLSKIKDKKASGMNE